MSVFNFFDGSARRKALIIVAHADDETIFMGGTILLHKDWEWRLFCIAFRNNKEDDKKQLEEVLQIYKRLGVDIKLNSKGMVVESKQEDEEVKSQESLIEEAIKGLNADLQKESWPPDIVFTHNESGEYGHPQHKAAHRFVTGTFIGINIWEFISPCATNVVPQPFKSNVAIIKLNASDLTRKREIYSFYKTEQGNWINDLSKIMLYQFGSGPEIFTKD